MSSKPLSSFKHLNFSEVYNILEKTAIIKVLLLICTTDEEFHADEHIFIKEIIRLLNVDRRQFEHVNTITEDRTFEILTAMDSGKKEFLYRLMKQAILADGQVHDHELDLLQSICERAGIPVRA